MWKLVAFQGERPYLPVRWNPDTRINNHHQQLCRNIHARPGAQTRSRVLQYLCKSSLYRTSISYSFFVLPTNTLRYRHTKPQLRRYFQCLLSIHLRSQCAWTIKAWITMLTVHLVHKVKRKVCMHKYISGDRCKRCHCDVLWLANTGTLLDETLGAPSVFDPQQPSKLKSRGSNPSINILFSNASSYRPIAGPC